MDPLHITEFASKRYYEKLEQLPKDHQQPQDEGAVVEGSTSKFILPIRQAEQHSQEAIPKHGEHGREKEKEKRGLFGRLRSSKSSFSASESPAVRRPSFTSAASATSPGEKPAVKRRRYGSGDAPSAHYHKARTDLIHSLPFDQLFLALPTELQIQIIASLPLSDVLSLRLASRSWHGMVTLNEVPIVRYQLEHEVPAYAKRLYPITDASSFSLHYLCGLWNRLHVAAKLSRRMCDWCTKEIFLKTTKDQVASFAGQRERMYRRLIPLLFTIFHFFENYRKLQIQYFQEHGYGVERTPYTIHPIESQIMAMYDDRTLLQVHQVFPMVVSSFLRRLRPPSYVGRLERTVRGYLREKPADEVSTAVLSLGGLRQVLRFWEVKGYNTRIGSVEAWYNELQESKEAPRVTETCATTIPTAKEVSKPRRGIMGLGRKKSTWQVRDATAAKADDAPGLATTTASTTTRDSLERSPSRTSSLGGPPSSSSLVFRTSLAAGMPMGRLEHEQYSFLLSDLPPLQKVWLTTAESLILDRKIVERPADIKRNTQMIVDLIKEDGVVEEDLWWYSMGPTKSIRPPPLEAIEEDSLE